MCIGGVCCGAPACPSNANFGGRNIVAVRGGDFRRKQGTYCIVIECSHTNTHSAVPGPTLGLASGDALKNLLALG